MRIETTQLPAVDFLPDEGYYVDNETGATLSPDEFWEMLQTGQKPFLLPPVEPYLRPLETVFDNVVAELETLARNVERGSKMTVEENPDLQVGETKTTVQLLDVSKWELGDGKAFFFKEQRTASCLGDTDTKVKKKTHTKDQLSSEERTQLKELCWALSEILIALKRKLMGDKDRPLLPFHEEVITGLRSLANDLPCPTFSLIEALKAQDDAKEAIRRRNRKLRSENREFKDTLSATSDMLKEVREWCLQERERARHLSKQNRTLRARTKVLGAQGQNHRH